MSNDTHVTDVLGKVHEHTDLLDSKLDHGLQYVLTEAISLTVASANCAQTAALPGSSKNTQAQKFVVLTLRLGHQSAPPTLSSISHHPPPASVPGDFIVPLSQTYLARRRASRRAAGLAVSIDTDCSELVRFSVGGTVLCKAR